MHWSRPHNCHLLLQAAGWMQMLFHVRLGRQIGPFRWLLACRTDTGAQHASQPECAGLEGPSERRPYSLRMQMKNHNVTDKCSVLGRRPRESQLHLVKSFTCFHTETRHSPFKKLLTSKVTSTFLLNLRHDCYHRAIIVPNTVKLCFLEDSY